MIGIATFAMMRTGHHAVMEWIRKQLPGSNVLDNNSASNSATNNLRQRKIKTDVDHYLTNFEDVPVRVLPAFMKALSVFTPLRDCESVSKVLVLRDAYNMFASRIRVDPKTFIPLGKASPSAIQLWKDHCITVLSDPTVLPVLYNKWLVDEAYRSDIVHKLGLELVDNELGNMCEGFEGGSSFGGQRGARPLANDLTTRYKRVLTDTTFAGILQDDEIDDLNKEIFGFGVRDLHGL